MDGWMRVKTVLRIAYSNKKMVTLTKPTYSQIRNDLKIVTTYSQQHIRISNDRFLAQFQMVWFSDNVRNPNNFVWTLDIF